ncbi:MAG: HIT family protein [Candidatus Woesearchaeota archaeon]
MVHITPEIQAQLDEQKKNCVFCKIIAGEIPSKKVYEDTLTIALLDVNPWCKGHVLFMQKDHYPIMPYIPPDTFTHIFGILPKLIRTIQSAMLATGMNVFIANGGAAGQQSPHFLMHIIPRESDDGITAFDFSLKNEPQQEKDVKMLTHNLPLMMVNHFKRTPAPWSKTSFETAPFLTDYKIKDTVVYEDAKVLCVNPKQSFCRGHLVIYSQEEEQNFSSLSMESACHLFYVASYCATAVFEGMQAHGSNIIMKCGKSADNPEGKLSIHILPRWGDDGLEILPKAMSQKPNLDSIAEKINDKTYVIEYELKKEEKKEEKNAEKNVSQSKEMHVAQPKKEIVSDAPKKNTQNPLQEIIDAVERIQRNS